jgi:hypothetical protein
MSRAALRLSFPACNGRESSPAKLRLDPASEQKKKESIVPRKALQISSVVIPNTRVRPPAEKSLD